MSKIIDAEVAARNFVRDIGKRVVSERFRAYANWAPTHMVLATVEGKAVGLTDAIVVIPGEAAEFSLVARPQYGANAIRALQRLRQHVPTRYCSTSLSKRTAATVAISRRFAAVKFDHFSLQIAGVFTERCGERLEAELMVLFQSGQNVRARASLP